jgi:hypothetical protein
MGRFPKLSVMVDFGLDGRDGVNPVDLFREYRKHTADDLYTALVHDKLSELTGVPRVSSGLLSNKA